MRTKRSSFGCRKLRHGCFLNRVKDKNLIVRIVQTHFKNFDKKRIEIKISIIQLSQKEAFDDILFFVHIYMDVLFEFLLSQALLLETAENNLLGFFKQADLCERFSRILEHSSFPRQESCTFQSQLHVC